MYVIEIQARSGEPLYVAELTATSVSYTPNWRRAERFLAADLPAPAECEVAGAKVVGYAAV